MIKITENCDVSRYTTFGISAQARYFITYDDPVADLPELHAGGWFDKPYIHIGGGSNMLFTKSFEGAVIKSLARGKEQKEEDAATGESTFTYQTGWELDKICLELAKARFWGMENLSGIPGTIGGAAIQNVGAYGVELKDVAVKVSVFDTHTGQFSTLLAEECGYGYRWSSFKSEAWAGRYIVTDVTLRASRAGEPRLGYGHLKSAVEDIASGARITPMMVREAVIAMRDSKLPDPRRVGSAGSFFKNPEVEYSVYEQVVTTARAMWGEDTTVPHYDLPDGRVKIPAAWFIDRCGWKGHRNGGAAVWEKQPLVLVNLTGDATATDVTGLQQMITDDIKEKFGITLYPEVVKV